VSDVANAFPAKRRFDKGLATVGDEKSVGSFVMFLAHRVGSARSNIVYVTFIFCPLTSLFIPSAVGSFVMFSPPALP